MPSLLQLLLPVVFQKSLLLTEPESLEGSFPESVVEERSTSFSKEIKDNVSLDSTKSQSLNQSDQKRDQEENDKTNSDVNNTENNTDNNNENNTDNHNEKKLDNDIENNDENNNVNNFDNENKNKDNRKENIHGSNESHSVNFSCRLISPSALELPGFEVSVDPSISEFRVVCPGFSTSLPRNTSEQDLLSLLDVLSGSFFPSSMSHVIHTLKAQKGNLSDFEKIKKGLLSFLIIFHDKKNALDKKEASNGIEDNQNKENGVNDSNDILSSVLKDDLFVNNLNSDFRVFLSSDSELAKSLRTPMGGVFGYNAFENVFYSLSFKTLNQAVSVMKTPILKDITVESMKIYEDSELPKFYLFYTNEQKKTIFHRPKNTNKNEKINDERVNAENHNENVNDKTDENLNDNYDNVNENAQNFNENVNENGNKSFGGTSLGVGDPESFYQVALDFRHTLKIGTVLYDSKKANLSHYGISSEHLPCVLTMHENRKYRLLNATPKSLSMFFERFMHGTEEPFYQSQEVIDNEGKAVKEIVRKNYEAFFYLPKPKRENSGDKKEKKENSGNDKKENEQSKRENSEEKKENNQDNPEYQKEKKEDEQSKRENSEEKKDTEGVPDSFWVDALVAFSSPNCGHCMTLKPILNDLGERVLKNNHTKKILIGTTDATKNDFPELTIRGYPTIALITKGEIHYYEGRRTVEDFTKFIQEKGQHKININHRQEREFL